MLNFSYKQKIYHYIFMVFISYMAIILIGCGYVWQGQENFISKNSVLGDGTKTLKITTVKENTLYSWLPYMIQAQFRNEITARKLATWVDSGSSDYSMIIEVYSFQIRSSGEYKQHNLLFTATIKMEIIIYNGTTNTEIWRSGPVFYSENYEHANEEYAIKELVFVASRRCVDRLQQNF